jgi:hypothetical protein
MTAELAVGEFLGKSPTHLTNRQTQEKTILQGFLGCRRRDSNPRHADYDSAALTD